MEVHVGTYADPVFVSKLIVDCNTHMYVANIQQVTNGLLFFVRQVIAHLAHSKLISK